MDSDELAMGLDFAGVRIVTDGRHEEQRCLCLIHPMDPRGNKVGGIQTHVRNMLQYAPPNFRLLLVGVDGRGDCKLGQTISMEMNGRTFDFLPVSHFSESLIHTAAKTVAGSITFRFALGLVRWFNRIANAIGEGPATIELQRFEFSLISFLLHKPVIQIIHGDGAKDDKMDSLLKRYWFIHRANEAIATRLAEEIICVNRDIESRFKSKLPGAAHRISFMPVPVDTKVFRQTDFDVRDGVLRVVFAGRLDEFKDPPLMFRALRKVYESLGRAFEFHYVGTSDPYRYPEFRLIESITTCHGYQTPKGVAAIMARCHMGVLTSYFEGMPCYLFEILAVGRPVVAIRLPQYDSIIEEGVSGSMVDRISDRSALEDALAARFVSIWSAIKENRIKPNAVHNRIQDFSVEKALSRHFARHGKII